MTQRSLYAQYKDYRKMWDGGPTTQSGQQPRQGNANTQAGLQAGVGAGVWAANTAADIIDANQMPDSHGIQKPNTGSAVLKGAASGAAMGSVAGPWGTAIGAVVGAGAGLLQGSAATRKYNRISAEYARQDEKRSREMSAARIAADPSLIYGNLAGSYYARGGQLLNAGSLTPAEGGTLTPMSSDASLVVGPSHAEGGVQLPAHRAELEGQETLKGDYVFSKQLGFAQAHRPLARAQGRIEKKPLTPERRNALELIEGQTDLLRTKQELVKSYLDSQHT